MLLVPYLLGMTMWYSKELLVEANRLSKTHMNRRHAVIQVTASSWPCQGTWQNNVELLPVVPGVVKWRVGIKVHSRAYGHKDRAGRICMYVSTVDIIV
jgi:hypothetical protein